MDRLTARFGRFLTVVLGGMIISGAAHASEPKLIATHGDWSAYTFEENGNKVCYMASKPSKAEGKYSVRGDIFALITHRPAEKSKNVFSYVAGYPYKANSDVKVTIDGKVFTLFTHKDMAWTSTAEADAALSDAIRKGSRMTVEGVSSRGTETKDTISLKGSGGAQDAINKACGY